MSPQATILALALAYALLGGLLLLAVSFGRIPWRLKAGLIVLTSLFYGVAFHASEDLLGWSAPARLPAHFQLLWARTIEPDLSAQNPGAIHLWVEELDDANLPSGVPRAYRLPYSDGLAAKVEAARVAILGGHPQGGRAMDFGFGDGDAPPGGTVVAPRPTAEAGGDASGGGPLDPSFLQGQSASIAFAPLPKPVLPAKDEP